MASHQFDSDSKDSGITLTHVTWFFRRWFRLAFLVALLGLGVGIAKWPKDHSETYATFLIPFQMDDFTLAQLKRGTAAPLVELFNSPSIMQKGWSEFVGKIAGSTDLKDQKLLAYLKNKVGVESNSDLLGRLLKIGVTAISLPESGIEARSPNSVAFQVGRQPDGTGYMAKYLIQDATLAETLHVHFSQFLQSSIKAFNSQAKIDRNKALDLYVNGARAEWKSAYDSVLDKKNEELARRRSELFSAYAALLSGAREASNGLASAPENIASKLLQELDFKSLGVEELTGLLSFLTLLNDRAKDPAQKLEVAALVSKAEQLRAKILEVNNERQFQDSLRGALLSSIVGSVAGNFAIISPTLYLIPTVSLDGVLSTAPASLQTLHATDKIWSQKGLLRLFAVGFMSLVAGYFVALAIQTVLYLARMVQAAKTVEKAGI